ncbi:MAG: HEAT repeat domain-containing protein [Phormidesmis sp.]
MSSPTSSQPTLLSQLETDAFLKSVQAQLAADAFDHTDQRLIAQMVESFGDSRGLTRLGFAEALGKVGKPATPALIRGLAEHENPVVRRACAKTMTLIADPVTIPTLVRSLLHDEDTVVRGSVVGAMAVMGEAAAPVLLDILASPDYPDSSKGLATWGLSFVGTAGSTHLYRAVNADPEEVRSAVVGALTSLVQEADDPKALASILNALEDTSPMVRSEAAAALGKLSNSAVVPQLAITLSDENVDVRKTAAMALMKIGGGEAITPLQTALSQETDDAVRPVLRLAIAQLEKKQIEEEEGSWD